MTTKDFPQEVRKFEIEAYKRPKNLRELRKTHIPFSGSPLKHPFDPKKVILVPDPYSGSAFYYEFRKDDIAYGEKLPSVVNLDGETINLVRLWIRKGSTGVVCTPFFVEETKPEGHEKNR